MSRKHIESSLFYDLLKVITEGIKEILRNFNIKVDVTSDKHPPVNCRFSYKGKTLRGYLSSRCK